jgi:hypothetical protein
MEPIPLFDPGFAATNSPIVAIELAGAALPGARPFATASEIAGSGVVRDGGPTSTGAFAFIPALGTDAVAEEVPGSTAELPAVPGAFAAVVSVCAGDGAAFDAGSPADPLASGGAVSGAAGR